MHNRAYYITIYTVRCGYIKIHVFDLRIETNFQGMIFVSYKHDLSPVQALNFSGISLEFGSSVRTTGTATRTPENNDLLQEKLPKSQLFV